MMVVIEAHNKIMMRILIKILKTILIKILMTILIKILMKILIKILIQKKLLALKPLYMTIHHQL